MPRRDTRLESVGAEFLVLGELLIRGITAHKAYTNTPGYDVVALAEDGRRTARISVKSRWSTKATGFIIKNLDCDFVVVAKLNRGTERKPDEASAPEFYVLPVAVVRRAPQSKGWHRVSFKSIPRFAEYRDRWELIRRFLTQRGRRT